MQRMLFRLFILALLPLVFVACDDNDRDDGGDPLASPQMPTNLMATSISTTSIEISWEVNGEFDNFTIWRGSDAQNLQELTTHNSSSFKDENLTPNTTYIYQVTNHLNDEISDPSDALSVTTKEENVEIAVPDAPAIPTVISAGETSIELQWTAVDGAESYRVYRADTEFGQFAAIAELNAGNSLLSFEDTELFSGREYFYQLTADNSAGESAPSPSVAASTEPAPDFIVYQLIIDATWSEETHPGTFAHVEDAHFSDLAAITHREDSKFWELGQLASPGIAQMAVFGEVTILEDEAMSAIVAERAFTFVSDDRQIRPPGTLVVEIPVNREFPAVTVVSMIGPSPDWFIGCSGVPLLENDTWVDEFEMDLICYDGGLRSNNKLEMLGPETEPQEPIKLKEGFPLGGDVVGTFTFKRKF